MEKQFEKSEGYWAVIPHYILADPKLTPNTKLVYGEISALSNKYGYCYAKNRHFVKILSVSKGTIEKALQKLEEQGYIKREVKKDYIGTKRKIYLIFKTFPEIPEIQVESKSEGGTRKMQVRCPRKSRVSYREHIKKTNKEMPSAVLQSKTSSSLEVKEEKKNLSAVPQVFSYFQRRVKEEYGYVPIMNWGKDGKTAKLALTKFNLEKVKEIIDWYLDSDKVKEYGTNISVALSADTINKYLYENEREI